MNLRKLTRLLLLWITLYLQTPDGSVITVNHDLNDTNSKINLEEKWSTFRIKPKFTVSVVLGNTTELQCRNESSEGKHYIYMFCISLDSIHYRIFFFMFKISF